MGIQLVLGSDGKSYKHTDNRSQIQKVNDANFRVPVKQSDLPYESEIAEKEAALAAARRKEKMMKASPEERELLVLKEKQEQFLDQQERDTILREHLESPRIAKALAKAEMVRAAIVKDESREYGDIVRVDQLIQILRTPEGDPSVADSRLREVVDFENNVKLERANFFRRQRDAAEAQFQQTMAGINEIESGEPQVDELAAEVAALQARHKAIDDARKRGDMVEARRLLDEGRSVAQATVENEGEAGE